MRNEKREMRNEIHPSGYYYSLRTNDMFVPRKGKDGVNIGMIT